ncbi:hypothetical protein BH23GEM6_BH23GEM6_21430 [soil metagenome]
MSNSPTGRRTAAFWPLVAVAFLAFVVLVQRFDAPVVLVGSLAVPVVLTLLLRPTLAIPATLFLLYVNVPAILTQQHRIPPLAAGAIVLLLAFPLIHALVVRREPLRLDTTLFLMLGYLAVLVATALGATGHRVATQHIQKFLVEGILLYGLLINVIRTRETLNRAIWTVLAAGMLLGALTTYQELTGSFSLEFGGLSRRNHEYLTLQHLDREDPGVRERLQAYARNNPNGARSSRANGPMDEPNRFAQILIVLLPLALFAYRTRRDRWTGLLVAAASGSIVLGMVFSHSRGAFATLMGLALIAVALRWVRRSYLVGGVLAAVLFAPLMAPQYVERITSIATASALFDDTSTENADGAILGRATSMLAAAQVFMDHPLKGVGPGQFKPYYSEEYRQKNPDLKFRDVQGPRSSHSLYFEIAAEGGVLGLTSFFAIFGFLIHGLNRERRRWAQSRPELAGLATAFLFSLLAYLGTGLFLHLSFQRYLWILVGLAGAALHILCTSEDDEGLPAVANSRAVSRRIPASGVWNGWTDQRDRKFSTPPEHTTP